MSEPEQDVEPDFEPDDMPYYVASDFNAPEPSDALWGSGPAPDAEAEAGS
jgi:hypothetical protein